jgi:tetratricopeptide (TPR) repeat protein
MTQSEPKHLNFDPSQEVISDIMSLYNQGKMKAVIIQARAITDNYPNSFIIWNLLGAASTSLGHLQDAALAFKKVTKLNANYPDGFNNLGVILQKQGKLVEANKAFRKAIKLKPEYKEPYVNLGNSLREQGQFEKALVTYRDVLALDPKYIHALTNLGILLKKTGKINQAISTFQTALSYNENDPEIYNNLGNAYLEQGKFKEAEIRYRKAISIKPNYAQAHNNLAASLEDQNKPEEAVKAYQEAVKLKPDYSDAYVNLGNILRRRGEKNKAIKAYRNAQRCDPKNADAHNSEGNLYLEQGNTEKGILCYKKALKVDAHHVEAIRQLSLLKSHIAGDPQISFVEKLLKSPMLPKVKKCPLYYAYAKMNEDLGNYREAFQNYDEGGRIKKESLKYDIIQDQAVFKQIKNASIAFKKFEPAFNPSLHSNSPIFILGMPRSGTTLAEQIISSHSKVFGAGELTFLRDLGSALCRGVTEVNLDRLTYVKNEYLRQVSTISDKSLFFTDKFPQNFLYIALIFTLFPTAKVVHTKRNPKAVCWSNFKQYFSVNGLGYSYQLADTVLYFELYQNLMDFWENLYGDRIFHLDYELLTVNQEDETRRLLKYLDINWENNCLHPHKNNRPVRTASKQQVKAQVYSGSSNMWLKFKPFLNGALDNLQS